MDKDFSLRISQNIKNEYKTLNASNDIDFKEINEISLFDDGEEKINMELFTKEGFVENLYENSPYGKTKYSKEELEIVYDELAKMSDKEGEISAEELKLLASMGDKGDKNAIDKSDIKAVLTNLQKTENIKTVLRNDERIKEDENGNKYVEVEKYNFGNTPNDCLSNIVKNSYDLEQMGIQEKSQDYSTLLKVIMDKNPDVYGTEEQSVRPTAGGIGRENSVLFKGDKIILPEFKIEPPTKPEPPQKLEENNNTSSLGYKPQYTERMKQGFPDGFADLNPADRGIDTMSRTEYILNDGTLVVHSHEEPYGYGFEKKNGFNESYDKDGKYESLTVDWQKFENIKDSDNLDAFIEKEAGITKEDLTNYNYFRTYPKKMNAFYEKMEMAGITCKDNFETIKQKLKDFDAKNEAKVENIYEKEMALLAKGKSIEEVFGKKNVLSTKVISHNKSGEIYATKLKDNSIVEHGAGMTYPHINPKNPYSISIIHSDGTKDLYDENGKYIKTEKDKFTLEEFNRWNKEFDKL